MPGDVARGGGDRYGPHDAHGVGADRLMQQGAARTMLTVCAPTRCCSVGVAPTA